MFGGEQRVVPISSRDSDNEEVTRSRTGVAQRHARGIAKMNVRRVSDFSFRFCSIRRRGMGWKKVEKGCHGDRVGHYEKTRVTTKLFASTSPVATSRASPAYCGTDRQGGARG